MVKCGSMKKVVGAALIAGVVGLAAGGVVGHYVNPATVEVDKIITKEVMVPGPVVTEYVDVPVEVPVEVEVLVDNGNLRMVLDEIYDNDGQVDYLTEDLDDGEIDEIVERIAFINEAKDLAVAEVEREFADEIDREEFLNVSFDEDDIEKVRVQDDHDEIKVLDVDYDDGDAELLVTVKFEHDDVDYEADVEVRVSDGEVDDISIEEVRLR